MEIPKEVKIDKTVFSHCARELQKNIEKEADAITSYQELLMHMQHYYVGDMDEANRKKYDKARDIICEQIKEFISDELNHQEGLVKLYSFVTGIQPNID